jgi:hypothetical protein
LATTYYVDVNNTNPTPPYADWTTAATNIQNAIDAATNGDTVLVTNGVYSTGGISMDGSVTNLVTLDKALTVQSVNGPFLTIIQNVTNSNVRCAWLTNNATLIGFTLRGGSSGTESGGGVWGASSNQAVVANCVIVSNTANFSGGGAYQVNLNNCLISSNTTSGPGSGACGAILNSCTVVSNSGNPGVYLALATNCIIYYNAENYSGPGTLSYCCTIPLPAGPGNFTNAPNLFLDGIHLDAGSPCIGKGTNVVTGTDIFGEPWSNPPSIGCAEWQSTPAVAAPRLQFTSAPAGFILSAPVDSPIPSGAGWFKDGAPLQTNGNFNATATTQLVVTGLSLAEAGSYQLVATNFYGVSTSLVATISGHCVNVAGTNPVAPYSTWATAATNIQDAIGAATGGDFILVTNGVYSFGGVTMDGVQTNRVAVNKAVLVQSVNGPWATTIKGGGTINGPNAVRCAWVMDNAVLAGFTLTAGATGTSGSTTTTENGGGVWCTSSNALVANCVIVSNTAYLDGGGAYRGALNNCLISSNGVQGAYNANLTNCTVTSNAANGVYLGAVANCIIYYNGGPNAYAGGGSFSRCCITPLPFAGNVIGNFTNAPLFSADGIHLTSQSPCIHAGLNATGTDIFGQPWASPPAVGCAEFQFAPVVEAIQIQLTSIPLGFTASATVNGLAPFTYFWIENGKVLKNGGNFTSTTGSNLVATGITLADAGSYQLVVSNAYGVATSSVVTLGVHCVDAHGTNPVPPYAGWSTAATNIQDAIDNAAANDVVLVTNGLYNSGGKSMDGALTNRISVNKALAVIAVNGWSATTIEGAWDPNSMNGPLSVRCAWLTNGAILSGFTLQNGSTLASGSTSSTQGAGVWCPSTNAMVYNCFFSNNIAIDGGGIFFGTLNNSLLINNQAAYGGGAYYSTLNNCTVQNNNTTTAARDSGAGTYDCNVRNSIVVANFDSFEAGEMLDNYNPQGYPEFVYNYSCTDPLPAGGTSNIDDLTVNPQLLGWYHIAASSPCRGTGSALYASGTDLDGESWANPPSMGCDEVVLSDRVGPLSVNFVATPLVYGYMSFFATIAGQAATVSWAFGDGTIATNVGVAMAHSWTNGGQYIVTFTAYNETHPTGVSTNMLVFVSPLPPPLSPSAALTNNTFEFTFQGQAQSTYVVQFATNLAPPVTWQTLQTISPSSTAPIQISDSIGTNTARFYRVLTH